MAIYSIAYRRPGEPVASHRLEAKSDAEARIRFLNLSWVAFTGIEIDSIALAHDQPEEAKQAARAASRRPQAARTAPPPETAPPGFDWRAECDRLTEKIGKLADVAQACRRAGKHALADAKMAEAKKLAAQRAALTKKNGGARR